MKNNIIYVHQDVQIPIDNWGQHASYEETRILDAFADLLWFKSPCSAVFFKEKNKTSISWSLNNSITALELLRFKTLLTLFKESNNAHALLSIHLFSNTNFIEIVKNQSKKDKTNNQYSDNWKNFLENIIVRRTII